MNEAIRYLSTMLITNGQEILHTEYYESDSDESDTSMRLLLKSLYSINIVSEDLLVSFSLLVVLCGNLR
jgi:hypothetical protein